MLLNGWLKYFNQKLLSAKTNHELLLQHHKGIKKICFKNTAFVFLCGEKSVNTIVNVPATDIIVIVLQALRRV